VNEQAREAGAILAARRTKPLDDPAILAKVAALVVGDPHASRGADRARQAA
jgi:hypothetical protein